MGDASAPPPGLFTSLRRLLGSAAELAEVRLALFATELQQEKLRALDALALLAVALLAAGVALVLLSLLVVMLFAEPYRIAALGVVVLVYAAAAGLLWRAARARLAEGTPFEATRAELRRDREALAGRETPGAGA
ncbi:phage holin family protein [Azohydromonas sediminis]|uniref:phage holin family protein n=1 Tax=Azohydromonas sediminis TaxID=2259674 RepID=UPI000E64A5DD|nr:phage holin family protein [Azohydromonas sediminis]